MSLRKIVLPAVTVILVACQSQSQVAVLTPSPPEQESSPVPTLSFDESVATAGAQALATQQAAPQATPTRNPSPTRDPRTPTQAPHPAETPSITPTWTVTPTIGVDPSAVPAVQHHRWGRLGTGICIQRGNENIFVTDARWITDAAISDDQQMVAYVETLPSSREQRPLFDQRLWLFDVASETRTLLLTSDDFRIPYENDANEIRGLRWLPTTRMLAFRVASPIWETGDNIWLIDAETGDRSIIRPAELAAAGEEYTMPVARFVPSPNGQELALIAPDAIYVMRADGTDFRRVMAFESIKTYSEFILSPIPVWKPDSRGFRVAIRPSEPFGGPEGEHTTLTVWDVPVTGGEPDLVSTIPKVFAANWTNAYLSPNQSYVAVVLSRDGRETLMTTRVDREDRREYFTADANDSIAFVGWESDTYFTFRVYGRDDQTERYFRGLINGWAQPLPGPESATPAQDCASE